MILTDSQIQGVLKEPVNQSALNEGRELEARHRLHITGDGLDAFLQKDNSLETEATFNTRKKSTKPLTKTVYSQVLNVFSKAFTTEGTNYFYNFSDEKLQEDFEAFLENDSRNGKNVYQFIHNRFHKAAFTGFQGVFFVDLPATPGEGMPEPYPIYIPSEKIVDIHISGDKVEYIVIKFEVEKGGETHTRYLVTDDRRHVTYEKYKDTFRKVANSEIPNELGYVPAFPISLVTDKLENDVVRNSHVAASIELADLMLTDHSEHELNKKLHAFQEKWSYGMKCEAYNSHFQTYCQGGVFKTEAGDVTCNHCNGTGRVIPTGPDKVYVKQTPQSSDDPTIGDPAGYITKDLEPTKYLRECMDDEREAIPKAIFSREWIVNMKSETATGKEIDMQSVYDKLKEYSKNIEFVVKNIVDTIGKLRYGERYLGSSITYSRNYSLKDVNQLEAEFKEMKDNGIEDSLLFQQLEEIVKTRHKGDPIQQQRHLILLNVTPLPTYSLKEIEKMTFVREEDKRIKAYINDYIEEFEISNQTDIVKFGSLLSFDKKIQLIKEAIKQIDEQKSQPNERQPEPEGELT